MVLISMLLKLIAAIIVTVAIYSTILSLIKASHFRLYYHPKGTFPQILSMLPILTTAKYRPPIHLSIGLAQMIYYSFEFIFPKLFKLEFPATTKEDFVYSDGGYSIITTFNVDTPQGKNKLIIFPGFTGSATDVYIRKLALAVMAKGFQPIVVNARGCGGAKLTTPKLCSFASHSDVDEVMEHLGSKYAESKIFALGVSQGASLLTHHLASNKSKVSAAICIATPFELHTCESSCSIIVQHMFGLLAKKLLYNNAKELKLESLVGTSTEKFINTIRTAHDFNTEYMIKTLNYASLREYLTAESCDKWLGKIRVPTLYISSLDDPVVPKNCIPYKCFQQSEYIMLATLPFGGHSNFYHGCKPRQLFPSLVANYLEVINY
jgi:predicted alpha/beta-fold hydrolase